VTRRADHTDSLVEKTIIRWLSSPKAAARLRRDTGPDVVALQAEAKALRRRLDEADEMFAAGELDRRRLAKISKDVRARLDVVEEQIAAAAEVSPLTQVVGMADVAAAWRELDIPRRQAIIDLVAEVVLLPAKGKGRPPGWRPGEPYFDPETVEFRWR
jgi:tetrahydromethanopterin S-methyltransferase subunit G